MTAYAAFWSLYYLFFLIALIVGIWAFVRHQGPRSLSLLLAFLALFTPVDGFFYILSWGYRFGQSEFELLFSQMGRLDGWAWLCFLCHVFCVILLVIVVRNLFRYPPKKRKKAQKPSK